MSDAADRVLSIPEVTTADDPNVDACIVEGVDHDFRPHAGTQRGRDHTWWRCVWCHVVSCGNHGDADPCMEPYHHRNDHRSRGGVVWAKGNLRPDDPRA